MNVVFRVDYSSQIGMGHLMRCLTLADGLKKHGVKSFFICRNLAPGHNSLIEKNGHNLMLLAKPGHDNRVKFYSGNLTHADWLGVPWQQDAGETRVLIEKLKPAWLIVDHYAIDDKWEKVFHDRGLKLMVIDDLADRKHHCDLLLDSNFLRKESDYAGLLPETAYMCLGTDYVLLRPEFKKLRKKALARRQNNEQINRILVFMGGADPENITADVLRGIAKTNWNNLPVIDVVLGPLFKGIDRIKQIIDTQSLNIVLQSNIENMAELMLAADLAIGAAGASTWERCCLGLPTISLKIANNQEYANRMLAADGIVKKIDGQSDLPQAIAIAIEELMTDPVQLNNLSRRSSSLVDGAGVSRVIQVMSDLSGNIH